MSETFIYKHAVFHGDPDPEVLGRAVTLAFGKNREDKSFTNRTGTVEQIVEALTTFQIGRKDGACMLQGEVVGGRRTAQAMIRNHVLMADIDNGETWKTIERKIADFFYVAWTTHSHGKSITEVSEKALERYAVQTKQPFDPAADLTALGRSYLMHEKGYTEDLIETVVYRGREPSPNGVVLSFQHDAMEKWRILFLLKDPWDFTAGDTQANRIEGWKLTYEAFCEARALPFDKSCSDPSRLMYLPRVATAAFIDPASGNPLGARVIVHPGPLLDLSLYERAPEDLPAGFRGLSGPSEDKETFEPATAGLKRFVSQYPDFDPIEWLRHVDPDGERRGTVQSGGAHWRCPNEDNHTEVKDDDSAFAIFRDEHAETPTWGMGCMHATCIGMSKKDRLWYLDRLCQQVGASVSDLRAFSETARREDLARASAVEVAAQPTALRDAVDRLTIDSPKEEKTRVLQALAALTDPLDRAPYLKSVSKAVGLTVAKLERHILGLQKAEEDRVRQEKANEALEDGVSSTGHAVPDDLTNPNDTIWLDWPPRTQVEASLRKLERKNRTRPYIFQRPEGGIVRVDKAADGTMSVTPVMAQQWQYELTMNLTYKETDAFGRAIEVHPPKSLVSAVLGAGEYNFPEFRSISRFAVFGQDGKLKTSKGYDPGTKTYVDPNYVPIPVSEQPTDEDVAVAVDWLVEAIRDFPFSDLFDGSEDAPIKTEERDNEGYLIPNWDRGASSRANAIAMILQPFARNLISGPAPAYHIDKPAPGSGAGFLVDVAHIIAEGRPPEIQTMSVSNEEFRKNITATLRSGSSIIFIDNINRKVDSGDLAAALTSGVWRDRILGKSETVTIPVSAMWIMAGNNLSFSHELMRRNVPIRLDASTPRPAHDRGKDAFKHFPLQPWLLEHRSELIWACHTLIANWIAKGRPRGNAFIHSFDQWSFVMSGILECAGVPGFLDNVPAYLMTKDDDQSEAGAVIDKAIEVFGLEPFTTTELIEQLKDPMTGKLAIELPITGHTEQGLIISFGRWWRQHVTGAAFAIPDASRLSEITTKTLTEALGKPTETHPWKVKVRAGKLHNVSQYRFVPAK